VREVLMYFILTQPALAPQVVAPVQLIPPPGLGLVVVMTPCHNSTHIAANLQPVRRQCWQEQQGVLL
jgi:hypothetical protein